MQRRAKIFEDNAKILYEGTEPGILIQYFKDDSESGDQSAEQISGKGVLNNRISAHLMTKLEGIGVPTNFIKSLNMREQLVREVEIVPVEIVMRNISAGELSKRIDLEEGTALPRPIVEFYHKSKDGKKRMVNDDHIVALGWADPYELEEMVSMAYRANDYLNGLFAGIGAQLANVSLEFGRIYGDHGELYLVLADEVSPEKCRLWDTKDSDTKLFCSDGVCVTQGYEEIAFRLGLIPQKETVQNGGINEQLFENLETIENELARHRRLKDLKKSKPSKV